MQAMQSELPRKKSVLKQIFESYAEESITDEQVERILAPVRVMILSGMFGGNRRPFLYLSHQFSDAADRGRREEPVQTKIPPSLLLIGPHSFKE